jgi:hypothetical protein
MKFTLHATICLALAGASFGSAAIAADPPNVVTQAARNVPDRTVQVLVAQSEIKSNINPSNIAVATGGGLLGGLMAASQNASRTKKAEAAIEPLRVALTGFDVDRLAQDTTAAALAQVPWLQSANVSFSKDSSPVGKSGALDAGSASQIAFIEYSYDLSPDFETLRVVAKVDFANKAVPAASAGKPESRVSRKNLAYSQQITSIVALASPGPNMGANSSLWSADEGKRARDALTMAFAEIQQLLPRALALTPAQVSAMAAKTNPKSNAGGYAGRLVESNGGDTLLWGPGFIRLRTLP